MDVFVYVFSHIAKYWKVTAFYTAHKNCFFNGNCWFLIVEDRIR